MSDFQRELDRLHVHLEFKHLKASWAKAEILLGFMSASTGLLCGIYAVLRFDRDQPWVLLIASVLLQSLGGYLVLAGHRSHLYQSHNKLAAWITLRLANHDK